jgi:hypothetical protein
VILKKIYERGAGVGEESALLFLSITFKMDK